MKKLFVFIAFITIGLGTVACSSDDAGLSQSEYPTAIIGNWVESKLIYLDENMKVILIKDAFNIHGCSLAEIDITAQAFARIHYYQYSHNETCEKGIEMHTYTLDGDQLETEFIGDDYIDQKTLKIVSLFSSKLILQQETSLYGNGAPKEAYYTQTVYYRN